MLRFLSDGQLWKELHTISKNRKREQAGSFANLEDPDGTPIYLWETASVPAAAQ